MNRTVVHYNTLECNHDTIQEHDKCQAILLESTDVENNDIIEIHIKNANGGEIE